MKQILNTLLVLAGLSFGLAACETENSVSNTGSHMNMPTATSTGSDPHPAFVFCSNSANYYSHHWWNVDAEHVTNYHSTIAVCDSDLTDVADIYQCANLSDTAISATWSPTGAYISFVEAPRSYGAGTYSIKMVDLTLTPNGDKILPKGSSATTVYSASDGLKILAQAWSPNTTDNRIAFVGQSSSDWGVYLVSSTGGTPTKIYSVASSGGKLARTITWKYDGSELAVVEFSGTTPAIKVLSVSGSVNATLVSGTYFDIRDLYWSNSGRNEIAYSAKPTASSGYNIYRIGATSGSSPVTVPVGSYPVGNTYVKPVWSPDNVSILHTQVWGYAFANSIFVDVAFYKTDVSSGALTLVGQPGILYTFSVDDWKTP